MISAQHFRVIANDSTENLWLFSSNPAATFTANTTIGNMAGFMQSSGQVISLLSVLADERNLAFSLSLFWWINADADAGHAYHTDSYQISE